jgi:hypothetical protein
MRRKKSSGAAKTAASAARALALENLLVLNCLDGEAAGYVVVRGGPIGCATLG